MAEPRSRRQRIVDTLSRLDSDPDAWVASTDAERPWLAPLSFLWDDGHILFATCSSTPTSIHARAVPEVRVALGHTRDVVIIQGRVTTFGPDDLTDEQLVRYQKKHHSNPRTWADTFMLVQPVRILAWREDNEQAERLVMTDGNWLQ